MTIKVGNLTISIEEDDDAFAVNSREWDNVGTMVCWHRNYKLGDQQPDCSPDEFLFRLMSDREFDKHRKYVPDEIKTKHVQAYINKHFFVLPLYLYDHGGLTIKAAPFSCPWDSGQVGFIYAERNCTEYPDLKAGLLSEVEVYDQYLRGDVWEYLIKDDAGNLLASCCGVYGYEDCEREARSEAESILKTLSTSFCI
jgi:hypothetical protein